jgi:aldehyde:ferredoxin oxidoreductase
VTGVDGGLANYGPNVLMNIINEAGSLPTKNWTSGYFEGAAKISGEAVHEVIDLAVEKFGSATEAKYKHGCHPGCTIKCSNIVPRMSDGSSIVAPLEYESAFALGSNLTISNLEHVSELNAICNDLGLDTIETGNALGVAMEGGAIPWGDGPAAIAALKGVKEGTPLGRVLGSGAVTTGQVYGVERVAHVKGQSLPAYDPRPIRGIGVTYATGPMGADHTQGYTIAAEILGIKGEVNDPRGGGKAGLSRAFQETTGFIDSSGYCLFIAFAILDVDTGFQGMVDTCAAMLGVNWTVDDVGRIGKIVLKNELEFNRNAGFTKAHDRLPEFFKTEALAPHNVVFDVTDEELDEVHYPTQ